MHPCPLCRRTETALHATCSDIEYFTSDEEYSILECRKCGVLFISPMLSDRLSEIYPPNYYSFAGIKRSLAVRVKEWLDKRRFRALLMTLSSARLNVLDVGGGTGWLLDIVKALDPRTAQTVVVDIDEGAAEIARAAGHEFYLSRFEEFASDSRFDLILMLNFIEHVADPRRVLEKARSILKQDGRLYIKTPNFESLDARIFRNRSWGGYHAPRHFVLFQRSSFERLAKECGLLVDTFQYTQGAPFWSVSLLNELRRVGVATVSATQPALHHPLMPYLQILTAAFDFMRRPFAKLSQMEIVLKKAP